MRERNIKIKPGNSEEKEKDEERKGNDDLIDKDIGTRLLSDNFKKQKFIGNLSTW